MIGLLPKLRSCILPVPKQECEGRSEPCSPGSPAPAGGGTPGKDTLRSQLRPLSHKIDASASATGKRMTSRAADVNGRALQVDGRGAARRRAIQATADQCKAAVREDGERRCPGRCRVAGGGHQVQTAAKRSIRRFDNPRGNARRVRAGAKMRRLQVVQPTPWSVTIAGARRFTHHAASVKIRLI